MAIKLKSDQPIDYYNFLHEHASACWEQHISWQSLNQQDWTGLFFSSLHGKEIKEACRCMPLETEYQLKTLLINPAESGIPSLMVSILKFATDYSAAIREMKV